MTLASTPKRKRQADSDSSLLPAHAYDVEDSSRSKAASKFTDLQLRTKHATDTSTAQQPPSSRTTESPRKRLRRSDATSSDDNEQTIKLQPPTPVPKSSPTTSSSPAKAHFGAQVFSQATAAFGAADTSPAPKDAVVQPKRRPNGRLSKTARTAKANSSTSKSTTSPTTTSTAHPSSPAPALRRRTSPPPPRPSSSTLVSHARTSPPLSSPTKEASEPSEADTPPSAPTWHDEELTGHLLSLPDILAGDDGEGINGIGFRPTAQEAEARRARRERQVREWREREAREARARRGERRGTGIGVAGSLGPGEPHAEMRLVGDGLDGKGIEEGVHVGGKAGKDGADVGGGRKVVRFAEAEIIPDG